MKKKIFWTGYAVFVVLLLLLGTMAVRYVNRVLLDYEASQPEKAVESRIELIKEAAKNDTLDEVITFYEIEQAEYDIDISDFREYKDKIKNAKEISYKIKTGYSETQQQFYLLADGEAVAVLTLESLNEEIKLAILKVNEWQVASVTPILALKNYEYTLEVPKNFKVTVNGVEVNNPVPSQTDGWEVYALEPLYYEPEILIFDTHGNQVEYKAGEPVYTYDYVVKIPDNFTMKVNGKDALEYKTGTAANSDYKYCAEYAMMPEIVTYEIKNAVCEPEIEIYDNLNQPVDCVFENYAFVRTKQAALDTIPEEILDKVNVLEIAQMWSKLMTDDLKGAKHGFDTIKKYLITDSYLYNVAYQYVTSVDITFVATHVLENPPFSGEKITNYVSYGDNLFSCDIYFLKHMDLYTRNIKTTDEMNSTFYFMYYDETDDGKDNPRWVILDIQEILSK